MLNLETAIGEWRNRMAASGVESPELLDELENHLREEIERQEQLGSTWLEALEIAVRRMGSPESLRTEFHKESERKFMKRILIIGSGIVGVLAGIAFVMPAVAQYRHTGAMSNDEPWLFLMGAVLTLGGVSAVFASLKRRHA